MKNQYGDYAQLANFEAEMVFSKHSDNPLDWADAVEGEDKGFAPESIPDNYPDWKPKDDFVRGDEYED